MKQVLFLTVGILALSACGNSDPTPPATEAPASINTSPETDSATKTVTLDTLARRYIDLALQFGQYDENYVDAYTGPEDWKNAALAEDKSLEDIYADAIKLTAELALATPETGDEKRLDQMQAVMQAMIARIRMARGETLGFDEETALIYDAVAPQYSLAEFDAALEALDGLLPGDGTLAERDQAFRNQFIVPADKVQPVMEKAIEECRARTKARYDLPENERFDLEFVNDKPWSAYNYYQGDYKSLIQVNLDAPFAVSRALDLGCHEGYPGHHVWNIYMEREFLRKNNWIEYYVFPLYSPAGFFAEGSANYGVDIAFPGEEKITFERDVLYPIAGIDPAVAETFTEVTEAKRKLGHVSNHVAREYLDGRISRDEAVALIMKYRLRTKERAEQSIDFIDTYRGYIINYSLGQDMVRAYVESKASTNDERWAIFEEMLEVPLRASDLVVE